MDIQALFSVKDKVVLVTGGSRGIGEMIATGFVQGGAKVYISSRSAKACDEVAAKLNALGPGKCIALPADLQSIEDIKRLVEELSKREDHLDVLVNNAGATWGAPLDEYPDAAFQKVMNLNVTRIFTLTQACLPLLRAKASAENPSRVINIGSINGISAPGMETYAYSSSKAAVHHLSRHLAGRLGREHILVNAIAPGSFPSKMMAATLKNFGDAIVAGVPVGRVGSPEDIAGTCIYLASRAGQYTAGAVITVDGGALQGSKL
ncbi:NAD(P)-binding protein [Rhizopus microsporus var. microsporus]|uniref:NAD(P)-binding protein n=2 Tax=Rhizopus microsporus TaxID=58291 RepID=A0A2G4SV36_RHIZD|nr:NAD(P)-binding protein [Rhizopus microsporus ATCC 52813]ORE04052.1 NAD(P)-binding protein [Rhizopus microsporus var. microsporus]PHZ12631.1 NAD(P)-binding protein [Rhizopus microsporus ATCC 52813]